jgi:CheY-like chemotaxis protein
MAANLAPDAATPRLVLIAEPDIDTLELYKMLLVSRRFAVEHAVTGPDALAKALADPPDVVIAELHLPIIDGSALCRLLRDDPKTCRVPIIVIASHGRTTDVDRARRAGATSVLVKPCLPDALCAEVERVQDQEPASDDAEHPRLATTPVVRSRAASRQYQRYVTTAPPLAPPTLRCPECDTALVFEDSYVGGVTQKFSEQWDRFRCPVGCGAFQYRHRTRQLRRRSGPS